MLLVVSARKFAYNSIYSCFFVLIGGELVVVRHISCPIREDIVEAHVPVVM